MKKLIISSLVVAASCLLSSCAKTFYQVYQIEADQLKESQDALAFENDDCIVSYNLWSKGGNLSFLFTNKTDHSLYLEMSESFFIRNGEAIDYYHEGSVTTTASYSVSESMQASAALLGYINMNGKWYDGAVAVSDKITKGASASKSVTLENQKIICIPPYSSKYITSFSILKNAQLECNQPKMNYPKKASKQIARYNANNTPLSFRNRLAYTTNPDGKDFHYIDNSFWLSSYTNYSKKAATKTVTNKPCNTRGNNFLNSDGIITTVFTINSANRFYNEYTKKL